MLTFVLLFEGLRYEFMIFYKELRSRGPRLVFARGLLSWSWCNVTAWGLVFCVLPPFVFLFDDLHVELRLILLVLSHVHWSSFFVVEA